MHHVVRIRFKRAHGTQLSGVSVQCAPFVFSAYKNIAVKVFYIILSLAAYCHGFKRICAHNNRFLPARQTIYVQKSAGYHPKSVVVFLKSRCVNVHFVGVDSLGVFHKFEYAGNRKTEFQIDSGSVHAHTRFKKVFHLQLLTFDIFYDSNYNTIRDKSQQRKSR